MHTKGRKNDKNHESSVSAINRNGKSGKDPSTKVVASPINGISMSVLRSGVTDVGGTIRLALGAAEDMLTGTITPQEATVLTTAVGRVLKAVELQLKYSNRNKRGVPLALPSI